MSVPLKPMWNDGALMKHPSVPFIAFRAAPVVSQFVVKLLTTDRYRDWPGRLMSGGHNGQADEEIIAHRRDCA
jgi:hypothetical protein